MSGVLPFSCRAFFSIIRCWQALFGCQPGDLSQQKDQEQRPQTLLALLKERSISAVVGKGRQPELHFRFASASSL